MKKIVLVSSIIISVLYASGKRRCRKVVNPKITKEEAMQQIAAQKKEFKKGTKFYAHSHFYYVKRKFPFKAKKVKSESIVKGYHPSF